MNNNGSFLLNNEGLSLWKSGQPAISIWENAAGKPGKNLYRAEWRIKKSLLMQVINPFGEATISFSLKDNTGKELYTGSFKSRKKKFRKLTDTNSAAEYDVIFHTKLLQNSSCELLKDGTGLYNWENDNEGGGIIFQDDKPVANITSKASSTAANYKQVIFIDKADNLLLWAFIAVIYSY